MPANSAAPQAREENYENYGSVDLNDGAGLPPNWKRDPRDFSLIATAMIGHEYGRSDAFLTKSPRARHQLCWADPKNPEQLALKRMQGYVYVTDADWTINEQLWAWLPDEKAPGGPRYATRLTDRMMARPAERYFADKRQREAVNLDKVVNDDLATRPGADSARDQAGNRLVSTTRSGAHPEL